MLTNDRHAQPDPEKLLRVWDLATGACVKKLLGHSKAVTCIRLRSDGLAVSGALDGTLNVWSPFSGELLATVDTGLPIDAFAIIGRDDLVVTVGKGEGARKLAVWDLALRQELTSRHTEWYTTVEVLPRSTIAVCTLGFGDGMHFLDLNSGDVCHRVVDPGNRGTWSVAVVPGERYLIGAGMFTGVVSVWELDWELGDVLGS